MLSILKLPLERELSAIQHCIALLLATAVWREQLVATVEPTRAELDGEECLAA